MNTDNIDCHEYAKAASGFYPSRFNAQEWVAAIKASGAKYICITSRHHDGFSMFDTKYSDYDIVDATPFKRDVIKELAEECRKQGIRLHLYYSHLDWTREDYYPLGRTGHGTGRTSHGEWATYYQFMNHQLTELLTNYGPIGAIWFDGMWDQPDGFDWKLEEQYKLIHQLQPACLIGNNHHKTPYPGEDFQMFERDLPGENKAGLSGQSVSALPLETCETMNGMWGYKIKDQNYKSVPGGGDRPEQPLRCDPRQAERERRTGNAAGGSAGMGTEPLWRMRRKPGPQRGHDGLLGKTAPGIYRGMRGERAWQR